MATHEPNHQLFHRANAVAKRQRPRTPKKQTLLNIACEGVPELLIDAKLSHLGMTITQSTVLQAIKRHVALFFHMRTILQFGFNSNVLFKSWRFDSSGRQARHTDKFLQVFGLGMRQNFFKGQGGITLLRHSKCGTQLHSRCAKRLQSKDVLTA